MLKLAFLFLTVANIHHEDHWKAFLAGHEQQYSLYIHAKDTVTSSFFKPYRIAAHVPTSWEHTMLAQIELLREALKNSNNAKFIFVSETTIPLQPFEVVYQTLMAHAFSQFHYHVNQHLSSPVGRNKQRRIMGIPLDKQKKHTQWIVLNRKHAQILVNNAHFLKTPIFADNEHYPGTILAHNDLLHEIVDKDTTFVCWNCFGKEENHPYTFSNLHQQNQHQKVLEIINKGYLFARKFAPKCDLTPLNPYLGYLKEHVHEDL